jgi:hypothetical protein
MSDFDIRGKIAVMRKSMEDHRHGPPVAWWEGISGLEGAIKSLAAYGDARGASLARNLVRLYDFAISCGGAAKSGSIELPPEGDQLPQRWRKALYEADLALQQPEAVAGQPQAPQGAGRRRPDLNECEQAVWDVLAGGPLKGEDIADKAGYTYGHVRSVLPGLVERGVVTKCPAGYCRPGHSGQADENPTIA